MLIAEGKYIDTLPLRNQLSQGDSGMDFTEILVDRNLDDTDLENFIFVMRGVTESGREVRKILSSNVRVPFIRLAWNIEREFTAEPGALQLDLYAYCYDDEEKNKNPENHDIDTDPPEYLVHYHMQPVMIREV